MRDVGRRKVRVVAVVVIFKLSFTPFFKSSYRKEVESREWALS
jgi:hypothetical protein